MKLQATPEFAKQFTAAADNLAKGLRPDVPLDAFVRRLSRLAESLFDAYGHVEPVWLAMPASGSPHIIPTPFPPNAADDEAWKDAIGAKLRQHFANHGVTRCGHFSEAWVRWLDKEELAEIADPDGSIPESERPSLSPDRKEVVVINAEEHGKAICGTREIIRPHGRKAYLGKLEVIEGDASGRWAGLLPAMTLN